MSQQPSAHGTHGLSTRPCFFACISWIIVENYMLHLMLFVILKTVCFSSALLQPLSLGSDWLPDCRPLLRSFPSQPIPVLAVLPVPLFKFEDMCTVWWGEITEKWEKFFVASLLRNLIHLSTFWCESWLVLIWFQNLVYLSLWTCKVYAACG